MKKGFLLNALFVCALLSVRAQTVTSYGTLAGTAGDSSSYYGYNAGHAGTAPAGGNSFFGARSGELNTTGGLNTAMGVSSLGSNTSGGLNVAGGYRALYHNTTGGWNVAMGSLALFSNTSGSTNTALGYRSLFTNQTGSNNVACGYEAMHENISGSRNVVLGHQAAFFCYGGSDNVAIGTNSLEWGYYSNYNVAVGAHAMDIGGGGGSYCVGIGYWASPSSDYSVAIGSGTIAFNANTTALGYGALAVGPNEVRIGNTDVTVIGGEVSWSTMSDGRFKRDLKEDVPGLAFVNGLRPVSYTVDKEAETSFLKYPDSVRTVLAGFRKAPTRQTGFVAQEVEALLKKSKYTFSGVVAPQNDRGHYSIRYAEFVVPLVKAVQELSAQVEEQKQQIEYLTARLIDNEQENIADKEGATGAVLRQNVPNPFSADTEISMSVPETTAAARLVIYNMAGSQVKAIPVQQRGEVSVSLSGYALSPGIYFYALMADNKIVSIKRMVLTEK